MYNYKWYNSAQPLQEYDNSCQTFCSQTYGDPLPNLTNKYVYVKQNYMNSNNEPYVTSKVLVNPHFKKKVFVNPNFKSSTNANGPVTFKIHVNPNTQNVNLNTHFKENNNFTQKIHINPNILRNIPATQSAKSENYFKDGSIKESENKLSFIRVCKDTEKNNSSLTPITKSESTRKRRPSVRTKFKIIKSSVITENNNKCRIKRLSLRSKYKIIKSFSGINSLKDSKSNILIKDKFKVDNRKTTKLLKSPFKNRKFVYVNKFIRISDIVRNNLFKLNKTRKSGLVNISGIIYKKSPNSLRKATSSILQNSENTICKSKYKIVRKTLSNKLLEKKLQKRNCKKTKQIKSPTPRLIKVTSGKLRKCNVPCPYYRKFGKCKGKDNGKCFRKHDPDQIALCTKFLQGACIDSKCLLSHNVSPEKMPTCKFYLEGNCSKDDCPYIHVRLSPKTDICKDFLEGFCKKASECDKRHQFLCPDYEKNGNCLKQRCPYPHGKMVRKYSVFNKNKFVKKSSNNNEGTNYINHMDNGIEVKDMLTGKDNQNFSKFRDIKSDKLNEATNKARYYADQNNIPDNITNSLNNEKVPLRNEINYDEEMYARSRPKLGKLPSFIAFDAI